tara:strand:+ start:1601 stop:2590 length:990 start_codon:yes stop_codon:yes gene_type:complete
MMEDLIGRLRESGIPINKDIANAMESIDPAQFTDFDLEDFWCDRPVPFIELESGVSRTISAPHMIVTLLHHLEVKEGQNIVILGSKGGYLAALLDFLVGTRGSVIISESDSEIRSHTESKLAGYRCKGEIHITYPGDGSGDRERFYGVVDRVLITGSIRELPEEVDKLVQEGGFVLGPFGGKIHQRLVKRELQGGNWFDTDLGGVVFGPMDVTDSNGNPLDPISLSWHIEDSFEFISGIFEVDGDIRQRLKELVTSLREMPADLPVLDEFSSEEEILEHPVVDLLLSEIDWLGPLWPLFSEYLSLDIASPGSPEEESANLFGGHEDLIP